MIPLCQLPVCHYFFTHFFVWSGLSTKTLEETAVLIGEYLVLPDYREFIFRPSKPFAQELIGNHEYIATNMGDFAISYEENGTIHIELLREIDETVPVEYIEANKFRVEYIPFPIDDELMGEATERSVEMIDKFFAQIERQKMTLVTIDDE